MTNYTKSMQMKRELRNIATTIKNAALAGQFDFVAKLATRHANVKLELANVEFAITMESIKEGAIKLAGQKLGNNAPKNAISIGDAFKTAELDKPWTTKANIRKLVREEF